MKIKPEGLTPFSVSVKFANKGVSTITYVELNLLGSEYRLYRGRLSVRVDGEVKTLPYLANVDGVKVSSVGTVTIRLDATFMGLVLVFDLYGKLSIYIPNSYMLHVCGLCGLGYSKPKQLFNRVDRAGNMMKKNNRQGLIEWTNEWRVYDEDPSIKPV